MLAAGITQATGLEPELSTSGGTSDARFLSRLCPVVEFGLCNATMHKLDEAVAAADLETLTTIYEDILARALEIGRASCRERECPVRVALGGRRILKKKNTKQIRYKR